MKILALALAGTLGFNGFAPAQSQTPVPTPRQVVETLVCVRHGELTSKEIGQLDIRGLNRSLALPHVLISKYGPPGFIFAPNPAETIGENRCYVRPLATIEPTAILCGLPVDTRFGFRDNQALETEIRKPLYRNSLIFIAWEHATLESFVRLLVRDIGGDPAKVPVWADDDYDSIYVVKITTCGTRASVVFMLDHEELNGLSKDFPYPAAHADHLQVTDR